MTERHYEIVRGFFLQDDDRADPGTLGSIPPSFGLLSELPSDWPGFISRISELNTSAPPETSYKVLILGRHGEGYHNATAKKYGRQSWDEKWSLLNGDGETVWGPDADLTPLGQEQARNAGAAWKEELSRGFPFPQKLYCSPLRRALRTCMLTFDGLLPKDHEPPLIVENLREQYGSHTCDMRRARADIEASFPSFKFEEGFFDGDVLWTCDREGKTHLEERARRILNMVFSDKDITYTSLTGHGAFFRALLRVIGREDYAIPTGGIVPVVVKCTLSI